MSRARIIAFAVSIIWGGMSGCAGTPDPTALKRPVVRDVTLPATMIDEAGAPRLLTLASLYAIQSVQGAAGTDCEIEGAPERALVDIEAAPLVAGAFSRDELWVFEYCDRRVVVPIALSYRPETDAYVFDIRRSGTETVDPRQGEARIFGAE